MSKMTLGKGLSSLIPKKPFSTPSLLEEENLIPSGLKLKKESIFNIEIDRIKPNSNQPRQRFFPDSLRELADSIKEHGILQPLLVSKVEKDTDQGRQVEYQLIAGERRWRAAQLAGLPAVPVIVRDDSEKVKLEISLIENVQREDLNPIEKAKAYQQLHVEFGVTHTDIAKRVGKKRPTISNAIRLLGLPNQIKLAIESGQISDSHGKALLKANTEEKMMAYFERLKTEDISTRRLEDIILSDQDNGFVREASAKRDPVLIALEKEFVKKLNTRVHIRQRENVTSVNIAFYNKEDLDKFSQHLRNF